MKLKIPCQTFLWHISQSEIRNSAAKTPSPNPARIPPQTPLPLLRAGEFSDQVMNWCVFTVWLELILSKTAERNQTKEASPATARQARHTTEKYSLLFSFCARRIFSSLNEKSIFLWCPAFQVFRQVAGLASF